MIRSINQEASMKQTYYRAAMALGMVLMVVVASGISFAQTKTRRTTSATRRVPVGTRMKIRLEDTIDSQEARSGDRFTATVLTPTRFEEATLEGHLGRVRQSGKFKGRTSIVFIFDRIRYASGGSAPLRAQVVRVYGEDDVSEVDEEGRVESGKQGSTTTKRSVGGAVAGAVIGGIIGGGKGAAIGAGVGAGAGAGSVLIQGSKKLKLESGTEMLIRVTR
jgi:hypothetical protein